MWFQEYERRMMRQNPVLTSQLQGSRQPMPAWFSQSLVNQTSGVSSLNDGEAEEEESEYEEISEHLLQNQPNYCNTIIKKKPSMKGCCALCGNPNPLVQCDPCGNQLFCGSCNEMYHRHPKRQNHVRKLLDVVENRPPIPPKSVSTAPGTPIPPPRRNRGMHAQVAKFPIVGPGIRSATSSPSIVRKFSFDPFGSLKRFVKSGKSSPLPNPQPQQFFNRTLTPTTQFFDERRSSAPYPQNQGAVAQLSQRSHSVTNPRYPGDGGLRQANIPLTVLEIGRNNSTLSLQQKHRLPSSRDSGWDDEASDEQEMGFGSSHSNQTRNFSSLSVSNLHRWPMSNTAKPTSHFATFQRSSHPETFRFNSQSVQSPKRPPPPPIPPRDFDTRQFQFHDDHFWNPQTERIPLHGTLRRASSSSSGSAFQPLRQDMQVQRKVTQEFEQPRQMFENHSFPYPSPEVSGGSRQRNHSLTMTRELNRPLPPVPRPKPKTIQNDHEYYSGDAELEDANESEQKNVFLSPDPTGPWECEHCTFINPMSTRICTVCCKTPAMGYKTTKSSKRTTAQPSRPPPAVVKSKLSFSSLKTAPPQKIILEQEATEAVASVESSDISSSSSGESSSDEDEELKQIQAQVASNHKGAKGNRRIQGPNNKILVDSGTGEYSITEFTSQVKRPDKALPSVKSSFEKISTGTSPPPQEISTQTYEELPMPLPQIPTNYKSSTQSLATSTSVSRGISPPPGPRIEMSEKAMRLARRAQQQSKLKRSASTNLTSSGGPALDPWTDFPLDYIKQSDRSHSRARSHHQYEGRHLYRSDSRHSLASDTRSLPISGPPSRDISPPRRRDVPYFDDFNRSFPLGIPNWDSRYPPTPGEYFASIEDLVTKRVQRSQESELTRLLREAEENQFTPEDLQVALRMCGDKNNPIKWLQENWHNMIETVQTLGTKFGRDRGKESNEVGTISVPEARDALRMHKGNVWGAVTQVVEDRRKKFLELQSRGTFLRDDVLTALTANQGNLDAAYVELSKAQLKPFLMRIWGEPTGQDNESLPLPSESRKSSEDDFPLKKEQVPQVSTNSSIIQKQLEQTPEVLPQNKGEDEEAFADATTELDQGKPVECSLSRLDSASSEDHDSEESISHFIQNFGIPHPSPLKSASTNSNDNNNAEIKSTPSSSNNEQQSGNSESFESLAKAVSAITEKLGAILIAQEKLADNKAQPLPLMNNQIPLKTQIDTNFTQTIPLPANSVLELADRKSNDIRDENINHSRDNDKPFDELNQTMEMNESKSKSSKIYETIGNFAASLFKTTKTKNNIGTKNVPDSLLNQDNHIFLNAALEKEIVSSNTGTAATTMLSPFHKEPTQTTLPATNNDQHRIPTLASSSNVAKDLVIDKEVLKQEPLTIKIEQPKQELEKALELEPSTVNLVEQPKQALEKALEQVPLPINLVELPKEKVDHNIEPLAQLPELMDNKEQSVLNENAHYEPNASENDDSSASASNSISQKKETEVKLRLGINSSGEEEQEESSSMESNYSGSESEEEISEISSSSGEEDPQHYEEIDLSQQVHHFIQPAPIETIDPSVMRNLEKENTLKQKSASIQAVLSASASSSVSKDFIDAQKLVSEGKVKSVEKGEIVIKLVEMNFSEEEALSAANDCSSLYAAISFLQQECHLCAGRYSAKQMVSMLRCTHLCCRTCASDYFKIQIRDRSILQATCPFCKEPSNLDDSEDADETATTETLDYFSHLDILLKGLLEPTVYELFVRKLRDWTLAKLPNFKWCSKCSSGFITEPLQMHLICPDCNAVTCAICLEPWDKVNHTHANDHLDRALYCDELAANASETVVQKSNSELIIEYLNQNCIECPKCGSKFSLARGGCMHLTCTSCHYEFCSGCLAPFSMGLKCKDKEGSSAFCAKLGLHAHHPRNCLFYLRDKEPGLLEKLLSEFKIGFMSSDDFEQRTKLNLKSKKCQVPLQRETEDGLEDGVCDQETMTLLPLICKGHYVEYLGLQVWEYNLDTVSILSNDDLETIIRRSHKKLPPHPYGIKADEYRIKLLDVIKAEVPIEHRRKKSVAGIRVF